MILTGGGNITRISRELQISHSNVKKYLEEMLAAGLVEEVKLGRARYFFPAWRDPRIKILKELIESEK